MKILMLIKNLHYSGAPKMFLWVADKLSRQGHDVTMFTFLKGEDVPLPENVRHIHYNLESKGVVGKVRYIRNIIKQLNPEVSISFLLDANVYNIIACLGLRTSSIVCERNDPYKPQYYKLKFWKPIFRFADGAVYQLPKVAEYYSNIRGRTAVIPNPVLCKSDINLAPYVDRKKEIVTLGRIDLFQKRHDILVRAFGIFHTKHPEYSLVIYGDGNENDTNTLKTLIYELGLTNSIRFAGVTKTPQISISESKFFVLSSDFEGIPNALIEAMSIGMPCISTDCRPGGASFLIENGVNGFVVPKGDVAALAGKMSYLAEHPEISDEIGINAKEITVTLSESKIADLWNVFVLGFSK